MISAPGIEGILQGFLCFGICRRCKLNLFTNLLKNISLIHEKYNIPREEIATLLLPQLKTVAEIGDHLSQVHAGVSSDLDRALSITTQIRDYARMSEFKPGKGNVDVVLLLKGYGERYRQDVERVGITYSVEGLESAIVEADEIHLNTIFSNLDLNAKDALEEVDSDRPKEIMGFRGPGVQIPASRPVKSRVNE